MVKRFSSAFLLALLSIWMAQPASAQYPSTQANQVLDSMFTPNGYFGFPPYAADPFTCTAALAKASYYNTVSNVVKVCNGTAWGNMASSSSSSEFTADGTTTRFRIWNSTNHSFTDCIELFVLSSPNRSSLRGCDASGSDAGGTQLNLAPGRSTGIGATKDVVAWRAPKIQSSGSTLNALSPAIWIAAGPTVLTDNVIGTFTTINGGTHTRSAGLIIFTVEASDGTNDQVVNGLARWAMADTGGAQTCGVALIGTADATTANGGAASAGTMTCTLVAGVGGGCVLRLTCDTSLNVSPLVYYTIIANSSNPSLVFSQSP